MAANDAHGNAQPPGYLPDVFTFAPAPRIPSGYVEAHQQYLMQPPAGREDDGGDERERRMAANGKSSFTDNPGRTIYSQQRQSNR